MIDYLFICSQNFLRSPTAEHVARSLGYKAISAGTDVDAIRTLTAFDMSRADRIVCMEEHHARKARRLNPDAVDRIEVWEVLDMYDYCQPELIEIFRVKLGYRPQG